jgi:hypothetical protein
MRDRKKSILVNSVSNPQNPGVSPCGNVNSNSRSA